MRADEDLISVALADYPPIERQEIARKVVVALSSVEIALEEIRKVRDIFTRLNGHSNSVAAQVDIIGFGVGRIEDDTTLLYAGLQRLARGGR